MHRRSNIRTTRFDQELTTTIECECKISRFKGTQALTAMDVGVSCARAVVVIVFR
jgi:hypothetical protein